MMEEISRESYLAHSGLKPTVELQPIYQRYADVIGEDAFRFASERFRGSSDGDERRSARVMLEWQLEAQAARTLAELEEREVAWENNAMLRLPEGTRAPVSGRSNRDREHEEPSGASSDRRSARQACRRRACAHPARVSPAREGSDRVDGDRRLVQRVVRGGHRHFAREARRAVHHVPPRDGGDVGRYVAPLPAQSAGSEPR